MKQVLWLPLLVLLVGCTGSAAKKEQIRSVKCDTVKLAGNQETLSRFPGRVKASSEANIAFRVAGQIVKMNVTQGEFVRKGAEVARLDDRDYCTQLSATEGEYNRIKSEADRVIELYKKQSVTPNDYDKAVYGLQQITAKLEAHRNALADTRLVAPFDGYIQKKFFDAGETVGAGMAVVSVVSVNTPEIEINIPTADFIRRGEYISAEATIDVFPGRTFELERMGMNRKANLNQLYTTNFRIKGPSPAAPGMTAMVTIHYKGDGTNLVQIPLTALWEDRVWLVINRQVVGKQVQVREIKNDGTVLVEGITEGDVVVSSGINSLEEGQKVKVLPAKSSTNTGGIL